ncbi:MAG: CBS domain-containing protein [Planctomycetota bacterium]
MALTARDVMTTDLVSVTPSTPLSEFAWICTEHGISGCPVVGPDGRLVGIATKTDLLPRLLEGRHDFAANRDFRRRLGLGEEGVQAFAGAASESEEEVVGEVDDIMQEAVLTVPPETPLPVLARRMAEERVHRVLVSEGERLCGIVTSLDLLTRFSG